MGSSQSRNGRSNVLVIEDDELICKLLRIVLEHHGHNVEIADTYAAGISALGRSDPSIVLLDLGLPDGDGLDLLRAIREDLGRKTPVVVLTAFRQEDKAARAFELGADDFVSKPFSPRELITRIDRVLVG